MENAPLPAVSIVTVSCDTYFFLRLLVEKVREFIGHRAYEIIVVDRDSSDETEAWCSKQPDVRLAHFPQQPDRHGHAEAAGCGIQLAQYPTIVLLDSDAHPIAFDWLTLTADALGDRCRLAGPKFVSHHTGNPFGWYVHPHFMAFPRVDFGHDVILEKLRGETTDTGEEATIRLFEKGKTIAALPLQTCRDLPPDHPHAVYARFAFGHPHFPTISGSVFHAWYGSRLTREEEVVRAETAGATTARNYRDPIMRGLRELYSLDF